MVYATSPKILADIQVKFAKSAVKTIVFSAECGDEKLIAPVNQ
ncbi:MAG: hypothetical protein ACRC2R_26870 [Xenococcaceae cyanobacterium]